MVSKGILPAIVIIAILVIGGGIYMMQQPTPATTPTTPKPAATTPAQTPTATETPTSPPTPTPTRTPEETLPTPTLPAGTDEEQVEALVNAYTDAFDRHAAEEIAGCFTEDGIYISHYTGTSANGREKIKKSLQESFTENPEGTYQNLIIKGLEVSGDRANIVLQYEYMQKGWMMMSTVENITIIRVGDTWRIQKAVTAPNFIG